MRNTLARLALTGCALACFRPSHAQDVRFTTARPTTNGFFLQWSNSATGQAYTVQGRDRLNNGIWLPLDNPQPWPTVQTQWNDPISSTQLMRFYRVAAVQPATRGTLLSATLITY